MTIEERLEAIERELEHQRGMAKLREMADDTRARRVDQAVEQLDQTKKVLPKLQAAMKELEDAGAVTGHVQGRHETMLKDHAVWLQAMSEAQVNHAQWLQAHEKAMTRLEEDMTKMRQEERERGKALDKRISDLVSAIGRLIPPSPATT